MTAHYAFLVIISIILGFLTFTMFVYKHQFEVTRERLLGVTVLEAPDYDEIFKEETIYGT